MKSFGSVYMSAGRIYQFVLHHYEVVDFIVWFSRNAFFKRFGLPNGGLLVCTHTHKLYKLVSL